MAADCPSCEFGLVDESGILLFQLSDRLHNVLVMILIQSYGGIEIIQFFKGPKLPH